MGKIRVLIVDDSPTMRRLLRVLLEQDDRIEICAEAGTASEARDAVNSYRPDVMTLDVEMPKMSGIEFLERLMRHRPMPVVMISTLTKKGSKAAVDALALGAVECIEKPRFGTTEARFQSLANTLVVAAKSRPNQIRSKPAPPPANFVGATDKVILLGGSTGAVEAFENVLTGLPANCPPVLITQHMPEAFLVSFAARLASRAAPKVRLARDDEPLTQGTVLIAPGGPFHLNLRRVGAEIRTKLVEGPPCSGHRPSVDSMFLSAVPFAERIIGGILTGMGRDGAEGLLALREGGATTIGQSADSCVVFGMPRVAGEIGAVQEWVDLSQISQRLLRLCS